MTSMTLSEAQTNTLPTTAPLAARSSEVLIPGFGNAAAWDLANRIAKAFAASDIVPQIYRGNVANCLVAWEISNRLNASLLLVMQNLYLVHGNPGWSSKFLIASFNQCGRFSAMRFEFARDSKGNATSCRAWATEKATGDKLEGATITLDMAKEEGWSTKSGSKWKTMPEQMLMYRAAAFFVRVYAPEISMGLQTTEELHDVVNVNDDGTTTITSQAINARAVDVPDPQISSTPAVKPEVTVSFAKLEEQLRNCTDAEIASLTLDEARDLPEDQQAELSKLYKEKFGGK